jgi:hypothetical protein
MNGVCRPAKSRLFFFFFLKMAVILHITLAAETRAAGGLTSK